MSFELTFWFFDKEPQRVKIFSTKELFPNLPYPDRCEAFLQDTHYPIHYGLASYFKPKSILEIGCRCGCSLIALALGAKPERVMGVELNLNKFNKTRANWESYSELKDINVEFLLENSNNLELNETFDLINIDGDHTFEGAYSDIIKCYPYLNPGGVILMDDMSYFEFVSINGQTEMTSADGPKRAFMKAKEELGAEFDFCLSIN